MNKIKTIKSWLITALYLFILNAIICLQKSTTTTNNNNAYYEGIIIKSCAQKKMQGRIMSLECRNTIVFELNTFPNQEFEFGFKGADFSSESQYDFFNYASVGDSLYRDIDTLYLYKSNSTVTKWLAGCVEDLNLDTKRLDFGVPNANEWRTQKKRAGDWHIW